MENLFLVNRLVVQVVVAEIQPPNEHGKRADHHGKKHGAQNADRQRDFCGIFAFHGKTLPMDCENRIAHVLSFVNMNLIEQQ